MPDVFRTLLDNAYLKACEFTYRDKFARLCLGYDFKRLCWYRKVRGRSAG